MKLMEYVNAAISVSSILAVITSLFSLVAVFKTSSSRRNEDE